MTVINEVNLEKNTIFTMICTNYVNIMSPFFNDTKKYEEDKILILCKIIQIIVLFNLFL